MKYHVRQHTFGDCYLLRDNCTHFCALVVFGTPMSAVAVEAILALHSRFGAPNVWISDNGSYFKNVVTQEQAAIHGCLINGSIERLNRDIQQLFRTMLLDYKIYAKAWVALFPLVKQI
ncbi:hypothetical protein PHMEG_00022956 [Phytophthora megakarya]|uniref:Integrase catalytic domain-containing protein n=1 Tax=Phytophthora megakarya TaxID=4795 RepID=A0A225VI80_9STRA|nr:hypothetical protein PHMEG_00022956 [Phytophthora megakarya]